MIMNKFDAEALFRALQDKTDQKCFLRDSIRNEVVIEIPVKKLQEVVCVLLDQFGLTHLTAITVQDRKDEEDHFDVLYNFWKGSGLTLLIKLEKDSAVLRSLTDLIPGADFYEREAAEMFGIRFTHREETPPLLLPEDWDSGPPMVSKEERR
jgi:NADH:ubiquinone oxidoreductase subunit C